MPTNQSVYDEMCEVYRDYLEHKLVRVVRCKDCGSWGLNARKKDEKGRVMYGDCLHFCVVTARDFTCAWGEQIDNSTDPVQE